MRSWLINFVALVCAVAFCTSQDSHAAKQETSSIIAIPFISQFVQKDLNDKWEGPLIQSLDQLGAQTGIRFEKRIVPFKRAIVMTQEGTSDFGVFLESPKRNQIAMPVAKLGEATYVIVTLRNHKVTELGDLRGKTIARIRGGSDISTLNSIPDIKFHLFNRHEDGVRLLKSGRVDALVTLDFRILNAIEREELSFAEIAPPVKVEPRQLWLYWSWKSALDFDLIRKIKTNAQLNIPGLNPTKLFERYSAEAKKVEN